MACGSKREREGLWVEKNGGVEVWNGYYQITTRGKISRVLSLSITVTKNRYTYGQLGVAASLHAPS